MDCFSFEYFMGEIERIVMETPSTCEEHASAVVQMHVHLETCEWFYQNASSLGLDVDMLQFKLIHLRYIVGLYEAVRPVPVEKTRRRPNIPRPPPICTLGGSRRLVDGIAARPDKRKFEKIDVDAGDAEEFVKYKRTRVLAS